MPGPREEHVGGGGASNSGDTREESTSHAASRVTRGLAPVALDLVSVRFDREDVVAAGAQPRVDGPAAVAGGFRDRPVTLSVRSPGTLSLLDAQHLVPPLQEA